MSEHSVNNRQRVCAKIDYTLQLIVQSENLLPTQSVIRHKKETNRREDPCLIEDRTCVSDYIKFIYQRARRPCNIQIKIIFGPEEKVLPK